MDILVYVVWGIFTGIILTGNIGKKNQDISSVKENTMHQMIQSEPVLENVPFKDDLLKDIKTEAEIAAEQAAAEVAKPFLPVEKKETEPLVAPASTPVSALDVVLPNGMKIDQLMLDSQNKPMIHVLQKGETLTQIAHQYYEDARFWPYIFEVNRHQLSTPDKVLEDMPLYLPNPTFYDIDGNNSESIEKVRVLIKKLMK